MRSLDKIPERHIIVARNDEYYESFPDLTLTQSGKLICVYREADAHVATESRIILLDSYDRGHTWTNRRVIDEKNRERDGAVWNCPRLCQLSDGRLALISDYDDRWHEGDEPGIYIWWSADDGVTWSEKQATGCLGIVPDQIVEFSKGMLLLGSHYLADDAKRLMQVVYKSTNGGKMWGDMSIIAKDTVRNYCEGSIVMLPDNSLVCYMRENSGMKYPTYKSYSHDGGQNWTKPIETLMVGHRPVAGLLNSGQMLVTYRNVGGKTSVYAWLGHPYDSTPFKPTSQCVHDDETILLSDSVRIKNSGLFFRMAVLAKKHKSGKPDEISQFFLHPAENAQSTIILDAVFKCTKGDGDACAICMQQAGWILISPNGLRLAHDESINIRFDAAKYHEYTFVRTAENLEIWIDGVLSIMTTNLDRSAPNYLCFGNRRAGAVGESYWKRVNVKIENPTDPECIAPWWAPGMYPDQYQRNYMLEIDYDESADWGYSGWVQFPDGEIFCVYYILEDAEKCYIKGCYFTEEDFRR